MKGAKYIWNILFTLCIIGGGIAGYTAQKYSQNQTRPVEAEDNNKVQTDALSLRIFQNALHDNSGNILVAPRVLCDTLHALQTITGGRTREEIDALNLSETRVEKASEVSRCAAVAVDINVTRRGFGQDIIALPFSENFPFALSLLNSTLAEFSPYPNLQFATSETTSKRTKLLAAGIAYYTTNWDIPFYQANSKVADFDNVSGRIPKYTKMCTRGKIRTAKCHDNTWQAVALTMKKEQLKGEPLVFIAILPQGSARAFARELTPEKLTEIRTALVNAPAADTFISLPRVEQMTAPQEARSALRQLGINSLFSNHEADFSPLTPEQIHLGAYIHACGIRLAESPGTAPADEIMEQAVNHLEINRPFIWFIGDMKSSTPLEFMGLVEEL